MVSTSAIAASRRCKDVSLAVPEGAIVAVLGNNGAGKSTLLRAISGTLGLQQGTIRSGSISFAGRPLPGLDPAEIVRAGVVQVPEGRRIFKDLTVEENLRAGGLSRRDKTRQGARDEPRVRALPAPRGAPHPARRAPVRR